MKARSLFAVALLCAGMGLAAERTIPVEEFRDRMMGAWLGQSVGVAYGWPTEFRHNGTIIPADKMPVWKPELVNNTFEQDDLYVEMTFIDTLLKRGLDVTTRAAGIDFANSAYRLWCANSNARNNLRNGIAAPASSHPKFHRTTDDIDYQIEADFSGILAPGLPQAAVDFGETFGRIMNYGDGLYAGQFVGALYAEAYFETDRIRLVEKALKAVPSESKYAGMVRDMLAWHKANPTCWQATWTNAVEKYFRTKENLGRVSTPQINVKVNGAMVLLGLLYGEGDMDRTMYVSTAGGFDSDCNPSSACGVLGTMLGFKKLEAKYFSKFDRKMKWEFTDFTWDGLIAASDRLVRGIVVKYGGRIETDAAGVERFVLPVTEAWPSPFCDSSKPGPVPADERLSEGERGEIHYRPCGQGAQSQQPGVSVTCLRASHQYRLDEAAEFDVTSSVTGQLVRVSLLRGYLPIRSFDTTTPVRVTHRLNEPGFIVCKAQAIDSRGPFGPDARAGAGFEPSRIRTALPPPKDYDAFWKSAFAEQAAIEPDFAARPLSNGVQLVSCRTVQGMRMYGFLHIPKGKGPFPLQVNVGGGDSVRCIEAEVGKARDPRFANRAFLDIHLPPWEPTAWTRKEASEAHSRWKKENNTTSLYRWNGEKPPRERWYYRCILGSCRLVEYAAQRPGIDPARVYYTGASTGGGYGVFLAAFSPHIRAAICEVPNYGNAGGPSVGRPSGEDDRGEHWQTSLYYDSAYCAPRITCPVFMSCGYLDNYCTPETVYCIYNELKCRKVMYDKVENGHGDRPAGYNAARDAWLEDTLGLSAIEGAWPGFSRGMGIGGWLTNYKRFNVLPVEKRLTLTDGDFAHFDSYITEGDVERIKRWGFDHVRLGFDQIVLEEKPGVWRERTFRKIDDFIGWCGKHKVNVVLNLHKAIGNYCDIPEKVQLLDDAGLQERFIALWLEIERRYHGFPGLAFEILNEVRNVDPEKWNALADRTIKAIREKNPDRWIVVGSTCWNDAGHLKQLKVWDDQKVVYTFHMYNPFPFTHQRGVLQAGPLYENADMPYPGRAEVERCLAPAAEWKKAHPDKILWNGEFGTIRHMQPIARADYMRDVIGFCKREGIPYCVWNYLSTPNDGNRFSLVDDDTRDFLSDELLQACLGWGDREGRGELKYMAFNLWGAYFGNPVCERDLKEAAYVLRNAPDVVGMQEAMPDFWNSRLFAKLEGEYGIVRDPTNAVRSFNPLLYRKRRLALVEGGTHVYAAKDNPEESKGFAWAVLKDKATGKSFISYSTHLWWKSRPLEKRAEFDRMRVNNCRELLAKVEALREKYGKLPVIGGGDLNTTENVRLSGRETPLNDWMAAGYCDAQYAVKGASPWSSNHGDPVRNEQGTLCGVVLPGAEDSKNSLDHVHYTKDSVEPLSLLVDRAQDALECSDHSPVIFTFKLK